MVDMEKSKLVEIVKFDSAAEEEKVQLVTEDTKEVVLPTASPTELTYSSMATRCEVVEQEMDKETMFRDNGEINNAYFSGTRANAARGADGRAGCCLAVQHAMLE